MSLEQLVKEYAAARHAFSVNPEHCLSSPPKKGSQRQIESDRFFGLREQLVKEGEEYTGPETPVSKAVKKWIAAHKNAEQNPDVLLNPNSTQEDDDACVKRMEVLEAAEAVMIITATGNIPTSSHEYLKKHFPNLR